MGCEEQNRLRAIYERAAQEFSEAATELQIQRAKAGTEEYDQLIDATAAARLKAEQTGIALERHRVTHGC